MSNFTLISHSLCPYVQRAAIVLSEKRARFTRTDIDLANKPDWFIALSPLGKTPVLLVNGEPIFESAVICEYLDETLNPRLHPDDPLRRAQHRSWVEFGSSILAAIGNFYTAKDAAALIQTAAGIRQKFMQVEAVLGDGPYYSGQNFCMVDAVFGPIFRYFDVFDQIGDFSIFDDLIKVQAWRKALSQRPSVSTAVGEDYPARLRSFLYAKNSELGNQARSSALVQ